MIHIALVMMLLPVSIAAQVSEESLNRAMSNTNYAKPKPDDLASSTALFSQTLQCQELTPSLLKAWDRLGFELTNAAWGNKSLFLLREKQGQEQGQGFYLFRPGTSSQLAWQTPHAKSDLNTGAIGLKLMIEGNARAFACSTISRKKADMAHLESTFFHSFTLAFARTFPDGILVQLHGFETGNYAAKGVGPVDSILSNGQRRPPAWLRELKESMRNRFVSNTQLYPIDIQELGATKNAQANAFARLGHEGFAHWELNAKLRRTLLTNMAMRAIVLECIPAKQRP